MPYELYLVSPDGSSRSKIPNVIRFGYTKVLGGVGTGYYVVPKDRSIFSDRLPDWRLEFRRSGMDAKGFGYNYIDHVVILNQFETIYDEDGRKIGIGSGEDANGAFLNRRIVAYRGGTNQSSKTDNADDMMKAIVRENLGSSSTTDYDGNSITSRNLSTYLKVSSDATAGPTVNLEFEWDKVLDVLVDLQRQSIIQSNETIFNIDYTGLWTFNTAQGYFRDRSGQSNTMLFSPALGNLTNPNLIYNYDTYNVAYVGDGETGADRTLVEVESTDDLNRSIFGRSEVFVSGRNLPDDSNITLTNYLTGLGREKILTRFPRKSFAGQIRSTLNTPYSLRGWQLGDRVLVQMDYERFTPVVRGVAVQVDEDGREDIAGRVESLEQIL